eukprot:scaffold710_cov171-Amphora_coffeaeformis.AAC.28
MAVLQRDVCACRRALEKGITWHSPIVRMTSHLRDQATNPVSTTTIPYPAHYCFCVPDFRC